MDWLDVQRSDSGKNDDILDRLILDIKAVMLIAKTDSSLSDLLERKISGSVDSDVQDFRKIIQKSKEINVLGIILISIGEIALASVMVITGIGIIFPSLLGTPFSPTGIVHYFSMAEVNLYNLGNSAALVLLINYVLAVLLLASAFYILRRAAEELSDAGLKV
ncbi:MAG: hypothetical protein QW597_04960 [Thermoplasmataceae archaeon]